MKYNKEHSLSANDAFCYFDFTQRSNFSGIRVIHSDVLLNIKYVNHNTNNNYSKKK